MRRPDGKANEPLVIRATNSRLILAALIFALSLAALPSATSADDSANGPPDGPPAQAAEGGESGAFSLIDWNAYKKTFNKNYSSLTQQLVRQKIFMSKMVQVFLVSAKWRLNNAGYYTSINQFSDLTPDEERRKLSGDGGEYPSDDEDEDDDMMDEEQAHRALMEALEEDREQEEEKEDQRRQTSLRGRRQRRSLEATVAAAGAALERRKRSLSEDLERSLSLSDLVRVPSSTSARADSAAPAPLNIKWVVPSNNPDYQPMDAASFSAAGQRQGQRMDDIPEEQLAELEMASNSWLALPVSKVVSSLGSALSNSARNTYNWLKSSSFNSRLRAAQEEDNQEQQQQLKQPPQPLTTGGGGRLAREPISTPKRDSHPNDRVTVDWRQTGCVAPPIDQGDCQSCYAVSSTAFLEWALCMNQGRVLTPLSVQYMISCGPQFRDEAEPALKIQFYGCDRGRSRQAMYFVKDYGLELAAHVPYLAHNTACPVEAHTPLKRKGYIRPNVRQHVRMAATTNQLELALKVGPVIVNFREPLDFLAYGGGMVGRCYQRGGHAMLVVGHGVENDIPYLLIKNSFGTHWGMNGYFKFDRKYTQECIKDFILPRVSFPSKKAQARRVKAYLAEHQAAGAKPSSTFDLDENFDVGAGGFFSVKKR